MVLGRFVVGVIEVAFAPEGMDFAQPCEKVCAGDLAHRDARDSESRRFEDLDIFSYDIREMCDRIM